MDDISLSRYIGHRHMRVTRGDEVLYEGTNKYKAESVLKIATLHDVVAAQTDELTRLRARVAELEAQVAGQQRVMENAIATLRKSLARRPSAAIHEVVFTLTAFLRRRSQP